jgi:uncharacterized membrane protein (UPF0182 family)
MSPLLLSLRVTTVRPRVPIRRRLLLALVIASLSLLVAPLLAARLWLEWSWFHQFGWGMVLLRRLGLQLCFGLVGLALGMVLQLWLVHFWRGSGSSTASEASAALDGSDRWSPPRDDGRRLALAPAAYAGCLLLLAVAQLLPLSLLLGLARRLLLDPFNSGGLEGLMPLRAWILPPPITQAPITILALAALVAALLRWPLTMPRLVAGSGSLAAAACLARGWGLWLLALLIPKTGIREPLLGADVRFGLARFPALTVLLCLGVALLSLHLAAALWGQLARPPQLSDGRFPGFTNRQLIALRLPLGLLMLAVAAAFWLARHQLLLSTEGSVPGAGWVDVHLSLPLRTLSAVLALITAALLLLPLPRRGWRGLAFLGSGALMLLALLLETLLRPAVQLLVVTPRELEREAPYLRRSIDATRAAFQLDRIRTRNVNPSPRLTREDLASSEATIRNIRLWDSQPMLATNRQLQQLRVFYSFSEPTVDRYRMGEGARGQQQVIITAREIDSSGLPLAARTWLNRHLVFTHGQGFTVSPVNTSGPDGLPEYFISDLGSKSRINGSPELGISREQVKAAIPIGRPSLYFGSLRLPYALAPTQVREFNYPEGDANVYSHYSGVAGVPIGTPFGRLAAALYLGEPRLLVEGALTADTRLLLRREVRDRVSRLVPFVRFEADPYLVSVQLDRQSGPFRSGQHQFWIVDGLTTSRSYPYSAPVPGREDLRYLRNSVKAIVDAYDGRVALYVSEAEDPLIRAWQKLFPELFQPLEAMPPALKAHIRYPIPQFELQTRQLLRYHVTDPAIFYSGDDVWQIPKEIYGSELVPMEPYHISAQLGPELPPEFLLLQPLTPLARPNLVAWLAARSDAPNYGQLELLRFPSQTPILGPEQITALINQNPAISQQFGLWSRSGAQVIQGNLLVMPVGRALLYVEPVYLRARKGGLPTLTRVVVSDGIRIAMEPTLGGAIEALLDSSRSHAASLSASDPSTP